jgi:hypothetical protein
MSSLSSPLLRQASSYDDDACAVDADADAVAVARAAAPVAINNMPLLLPPVLLPLPLSPPHRRFIPPLIIILLFWLCI